MTGKFQPSEGEGTFSAEGLECSGAHNSETIWCVWETAKE